MIEGSGLVVMLEVAGATIAGLQGELADRERQLRESAATIEHLRAQLRDRG